MLSYYMLIKHTPTLLGHRYEPCRENSITGEIPLDLHSNSCTQVILKKEDTHISYRSNDRC